MYNGNTKVLLDEPLFTILIEDRELVTSVLTSGMTSPLNCDRSRWLATLLEGVCEDGLDIVNKEHSVEFCYAIPEHQLSFWEGARFETAKDAVRMLDLFLDLLGAE